MRRKARSATSRRRGGRQLALLRDARGRQGIYDFALPGLIEIVGYKEGDAIAFKYVEAEPTSPVEEIIGNTKTNIGEKAAEETAKQAEDTADAKGDAA